jgi:hypothetical protein
MSRVFVVFLLNGGAADVCTTTFLALAEIFFAFVAAGVAAVVLGAHFEGKVERRREGWGVEGRDGCGLQGYWSSQFTSLQNQVDLGRKEGRRCRLSFFRRRSLYIMRLCRWLFVIEMLQLVDNS